MHRGGLVFEVSGGARGAGEWEGVGWALEVPEATYVGDAEGVAT